MMALLLNMVFIAAGVLVGAAIGWWVRGPSVIETSNDQNTDQDSEKESPKLDKVEGLMARLHQLTATVAADVGEHSAQVRQINDELNASTADADGVVTIVDRLITLNERMSEQLKTAETRLQAQASEIQSHVHEARTDALTTLFNRRGFDDELGNAVANANSTRRPVSLLMLDVDFFKKFNDTYGHQAGDAVLRSVARVVRANLSDREVVCRYGGEEFAAIFPGSDIEAAKLGAERVRIAVSKEIVGFEGKDLRVTASVGLSELLPDESPDEFVKRADQALYVSKSAGRNCSHWHTGADCEPVAPERLGDQPAQPEPAAEEEATSGIDGVSNREDFCRDIDRRIGEWRRGGATASVILMDIDRFHQLSSEQGEPAVQVITRAASQFLKATIRDMDHVARYSDSTFSLLLPTATARNATRVAERLRKAIERCELELGSGRVKFTVSLGVTELAQGDQRDTLLARAESALSKARLGRGNKVESELSDEVAAPAASE